MISTPDVAQRDVPAARRGRNHSPFAAVYDPKRIKGLLYIAAGIPMLFRARSYPRPRSVKVHRMRVEVSRARNCRILAMTSSRQHKSMLSPVSPPFFKVSRLIWSHHYPRRPLRFPLNVSILLTPTLVPIMHLVVPIPYPTDTPRSSRILR